MPFILASPLRKASSPIKMTVAVLALAQDIELAAGLINWLESRSTAVHLDLKLGQAPAWRFCADLNKLSNETCQATSYIYVGSWYGQFDEERTEAATSYEKQFGALRIGMLPVDEFDNDIRQAKGSSEVDCNNFPVEIIR